MIGKTISHYTILEKLGEGGMGIVYKAFDTKLERDVALKLLRLEAIGDPAAKERFIREARAASALNHPNITTIYEIDEWHGQDFICMEYVEGETVKKKIQSEQMPMDEVLSIATQTAEALQEAHERDIIHRDIKSENIMVTPKGQVKVMDFGLAKLKGVGGLTKNGTTMGTISYMSPEQARGEDVDHRTDIWSFGVVLYEMLTGQLPFKGDFEQAVIYSILNEEPRPIQEFRPDVPANFIHIINLFLEKDTSERYQSVQDVKVELKKTSKTQSESIKSISTKKRKSTKRVSNIFRHWYIGLIVISIALIIAIASYFYNQSKTTKLNPKRVVVEIFVNKTGDSSLDPIGQMAADWITEGLSQTGLVEIVPFSTSLWTFQILQAEKSPGKDLLQELADKTGSGTVITGVYYKQDTTLEFVSRIIDMTHDKLLYTITVDGTIDKPLNAIEMLRPKVMTAMASVIDERLSHWIDIANKPPKLNAYREYIQGFEYFCQMEDRSALDHFKKAVDYDSTFILAQMWCAVQYANIGQLAKTDSIIRIIELSREKLATTDELFLDMLFTWVKGDNGAALRIARQIAKISPADMWKWQWGYEALNSNKPFEALQVFKLLDPDGIHRRLGYWGIFSRAYHWLGEHEKELKVAREGHKRFPDELYILRNKVTALAAMGKINDLNKLLEESQTYGYQGYWNPPRIVMIAAEELRAHGYEEASLDVAKRAVQWLEMIKDKEFDKVSYRHQLATAYFYAKQWQQAKALFENLCRDFPENIRFNGHLGILSAVLGDTIEASRISNWLKKQDNPYLNGEPTYWRACIASHLGKKETAVFLLRQALSEGITYFWIQCDIYSEPLWDYPAFQKLIEPKG